MSTFEALKLAYLRSTGKDEPGVLALLMFGSVSGSVGATSVYPLNLVRTRLQASGSSGHPERYTGILDVVHKTYARDGWRGFYRGLLPTLAKVWYRGSHAHQSNVLTATTLDSRWCLQCRYRMLCMNLASQSESPRNLLGQYPEVRCSRCSLVGWACKCFHSAVVCPDPRIRSRAADYYYSECHALYLLPHLSPEYTNTSSRLSQTAGVSIRSRLIDRALGNMRHIRNCTHVHTRYII